MMESKRRTTVYLPESLVNRAKREALGEGGSLTGLVVEGLELVLGHGLSQDRTSVDNLRNTPIDVPYEAYLWALEHPGVIRKEGFSLKVRRNKYSDEPLVRLTDYGIVNSSYEAEHYTFVDAQKLMGDDVVVNQHVFVRQSIAEKLVRIDNQLRDAGMFVYVRSGWRHPNVQKLAYLVDAARRGVAHANYLYASIEEIESLGSVFPHASGGVVDVEIWKNGERLEMGKDGVPIHAWDLEVLFSSHARAGKMEKLILTKEVEIPQEWERYLRNRRILYHLMRGEGFYPSGEFWHWGWGDHLSYATAMMLGEKGYRPWYGEAKSPA